MRACELLEGMPKAQVMMFQAIAPVSAPNTTRGSTTSADTMPIPTVCATCAPNTRKATKLKNAAHTTACCGRSTRVDTTVAIEFAASCKPLRKSNASATVTSAIRTGKASTTVFMGNRPTAPSRAAAAHDPHCWGWLHVLDHDPADLVADVVETVDHLLEMVVDLDADEERHRARRLIGQIEFVQPGVVQLVGAALDLRKLLADLAETAGIGIHLGQKRHRLTHEGRAEDDRVRHLLLLRCERALVEQHDGLGGLQHLVDGVIHRGNEILDAAAVERGDEAAADRDQHFAGDIVGVVLAIYHHLVLARNGVAALQHVAQRLGAGGDGIGMAGEQIEEALVPRQQGMKPAHHGGAPRLPAMGAEPAARRPY